MEEDKDGQKSFDSKLARIEEINAALSDGKIPLERSVELFEEGMGLARSLESDLAKLERRIEIVLSDPDPEAGEGLETADFKE